MGRAPLSLCMCACMHTHWKGEWAMTMMTSVVSSKNLRAGSSYIPGHRMGQGVLGSLGVFCSDHGQRSTHDQSEALSALATSHEGPSMQAESYLQDNTVPGTAGGFCSSLSESLTSLAAGWGGPRRVPPSKQDQPWQPWRVILVAPAAVGSTPIARQGSWSLEVRQSMWGALSCEVQRIGPYWLH